MRLRVGGWPVSPSESMGALDPTCRSATKPELQDKAGYKVDWRHQGTVTRLVRNLYVSDHENIPRIPAENKPLTVADRAGLAD